VFVKGRSFTVRQPDDLSFLAYFYRLCVPAPENKESAVKNSEAIERTD
jgi:hypothetical protein